MDETSPENKFEASIRAWSDNEAGLEILLGVLNSEEFVSHTESFGKSWSPSDRKLVWQVQLFWGRILNYVRFAENGPRSAIFSEKKIL